MEGGVGEGGHGHFRDNFYFFIGILPGEGDGFFVDLFGSGSIIMFLLQLLKGG